jgi:hypothetical protein
MCVIVGRRAGLQSLRSDVGMGSSSHEVSEDCVMRAEISLVVAGWKKENSGGWKGGEKCGEAVLNVLDVIVQRNFCIFSEKKVANV